MNLSHLSRRFFQSLFARKPSSKELVWCEGLLTPAEMRLWLRMNRADKRHSIIAGKYAESQLGDNRDVIVAALMHDVGKIDAHLSLFGRVFATLIKHLIPKNLRARFVGSKGFRGKYSRYWLHNEIGADYLRAAKSDQLVIDWAQYHNQPKRTWSFESKIADVLAASDDQ